MDFFKKEDYEEPKATKPAPKPKPKPMDSLAKLPEYIEKETQKVLKQYTARTIQNRIHDILDSSVESVLCRAIGMDKRFGDWEVVHCNGRGGESKVSDWLQQNAHKAVDDWLKKAMGQLPPIPKDAVKSMRKEYLEHIERRVKERIRDRADDEAEKIVDEIFEENVRKMALEKIYPKTKEKCK